MIQANCIQKIGRDGALRRPRRVQRRNMRLDLRVPRDSFRPPNAGGDIGGMSPPSALVADQRAESREASWSAARNADFEWLSTWWRGFPPAESNDAPISIGTSRLHVFP